MFADCRSQFLLDRLGRCLQLFVSSDSTSSHEFASQFGLAFFLYAKNILSRMPSLAHVAVEWTSHTGNNAVTVELPATRRSRNNCGHTAKNQRVKTATVRVYTVTAWKIGFCNYYVAYAFVVCVQINNEELFFNAFQFENWYYFLSG